MAAVAGFDAGEDTQFAGANYHGQRIAPILADVFDHVGKPVQGHLIGYRKSGFVLRFRILDLQHEYAVRQPLQPGPAAAPNAVLVRHYYACRLLSRCDVAAFLKELAIVKIDIGPIAGVTPLEKSK